MLSGLKKEQMRKRKKEGNAWNIDLVFLAKLNLFQKVNIYYNEDHVTNLSRFSFVPTVQLYVS